MQTMAASCVNLANRVLLAGCGAIPDHGEFEVLWAATPHLVQIPEIDLCPDIALLSGKLVPFAGLNVVLCDAEAVGIDVAEPILAI